MELTAKELDNYCLNLSISEITALPPWRRSSPKRRGQCYKKSTKEVKLLARDINKTAN